MNSGKEEKKEAGVIRVDIERMQKGMTAAKDVNNVYGTAIVRKGRVIEGKHILQMRIANIKEIDVFPENYRAGEEDDDDEVVEIHSVHKSHYPGQEGKLESAGILIVDDSRAARMLLKDLLEDAGLRVVGAAKDVDEALERAEKARPDCVTLDISMPGKEGTEAIQPLLKMNPAVKIVMVSSLGYEDRIVEALKLGAVKFVTKPFDHEEFKRTIIDVILGK